MIVIPAIDIIEGKVVRLSGGDFKKETIYSSNPVEVAKKWEEEGAEFLHIVDLDGAKEGVPMNFEIISSILRTISIPAEVGGGIREKETIRKYTAAGARHVVLGTEACNSPEFVRQLLPEFGDKIAVSVDSRDGLVAIRGWRETVRKKAKELIKETESIGVQRIIWTDTKRDGFMNGIDITTVKEVLETVSLPITIAGGISSLGDIEVLRKLEGVDGIIIGKALYAQAFKLKEAMEAIKK